MLGFSNQEINNFLELFFFNFTRKGLEINKFQFENNRFFKIVDFTLF